MRRDETGRSIYSEMAARRSRSERLNALARDQGLAVLEEENDTPPASSSNLVVPDESESSSDPAAPDATAEGVDAESNPPASDDPLISYGNFEVDDLPGSASETLPLKTDEAAEAPPSPEETIAASEPLLEEEPQLDFEEEARAEAESLVDQIGPILDIQRLPKTKPSRVLSKTAAKEQGPKRDEQAKPDEPAPGREEATDGQDISEAKPKKKRVSLLDSYFKGLWTRYSPSTAFPDREMRGLRSTWALRKRIHYVRAPR